MRQGLGLGLGLGHHIQSGGNEEAHVPPELMAILDDLGEGLFRNNQCKWARVRVGLGLGLG